MVRTAMVAGALASGLAADAAQAAAPRQIDPLGRQAHGALADGGGLHLAWDHDTPEAGSDDVVRYCRIARGPAGCIDGTLRTLTLPESAQGGFLDGVFILRASADTLHITAKNYGELYAWTSTDGGATWGQPVLESRENIGPVTQNEPGVRIGTAIRRAYGRRVQRFGLGGGVNGAPGQEASALLQAVGDQVVYADVETFDSDPSTPAPDHTIVTHSTLDDNVGMFVNTNDDVNDATDWSAPTTFTGETGGQLSRGSAGIFLATIHENVLQSTVRVRKWDPQTRAFGAPVTASPPGSYYGDSYLNIGQGGGKIVITAKRPGAPTGMELFTSTDGGATWAGSYTDRVDRFHLRPHLAIAADGQGWVSWDENGKGVYVADLVAEPEPQPEQPKPEPPKPEPQQPKPPAQRTVLVFKTWRIGASRVPYSYPGSCVRPGGPVRMSVRSLTVPKAKGPRVKILRSSFSIVGRPKLTKTATAPVTRFVKALNSTGLPAGKTFALRWRVTYRLIGGGLKPKAQKLKRVRTLKASFKTC